MLLLNALQLIFGICDNFGIGHIVKDRMAQSGDKAPSYEALKKEIVKKVGEAAFNDNRTLVAGVAKSTQETGHFNRRHKNTIVSCI